MDNIKVTPKIPVDTQSYYPNLFFILKLQWKQKRIVLCLWC